MTARAEDGVAHVTRAYTPSDPDPIAFDPGDVVTLGRRDPEHPGWVRATTNDGNEGWAPELLLDPIEGGRACARERYDARELRVHVRDRVEVLREIAGWAWVRTSSGEEGWVPLSVLTRGG